MFVSEQEGRPSTLQVPLDKVSQQAEKDMCLHAILEAVMDRPHEELKSFQTTECLLDIRQPLVASHRVFSRQLFRWFAGANHINTIECRFLFDGVLFSFPCEFAILNGEAKVFSHFVLVQYAANF